MRKNNSKIKSYINKAVYNKSMVFVPNIIGFYPFHDIFIVYNDFAFGVDTGNRFDDALVYFYS